MADVKPLARFTALTFLAINLPWLLTFGLAVLAVGGAGWWGALASLLSAIALFFWTRSRVSTAAGVVAAAATLVAGMILPPLMSTKVVDAALIVSRQIPAVPLAELPDTPHAVVEVRGGRADLERMGMHLAPDKSRGRPGRYERKYDDYAAPIVDATGQGAGPVWLLCSVLEERPATKTEAACRAAMAQTPIVGRIYRAERGSTMTEPEAIAVARTKHGVSGPVEITVIETTHDLRDWGFMFVAIGIGAVLVINALWAGLLWVMIAFSRRAAPS